MPWIAGAIAGGGLLSGITSLIGGGKQASAATRAAQIQANALLQSANLQQQRFEQAAGTLAPFVGFGQAAMPALQELTGIGGGGAGVLNAPLTQLPGQVVQQWSPTVQQLEQMPGYQFALSQGLLATQSGSAATGLGRSGAAEKAAIQFATGLAQTDWQANWNQFMQQQNLNLAQQNLNLAGRGQTYNMLTGQIGTGLSAAGATAGVGIQSGANIGSALAGAGAAQAAGVVGAANAQFGAQGGVTGFGQSIAGIPQNILLGNLFAAQAAQAQGQNPGAQPFFSSGTDAAAAGVYTGPGVNPQYFPSPAPSV